MYLHLGEDISIRQRDVLGVFDLETSSLSKITRDYLKNAQQSGDVVNVSLALPKSFVLCSEKKRQQRLYISQISTATLYKRAIEGEQNER